MNPLLIVALAGCSLVAFGCSHSSSAPADREPYVKPALIMLTADQAARRGIAVRPPAEADGASKADLQPLDSTAVVTTPGIKVYTLNRAIDPADAELMHEEHVVYRRETGPHWRLQAPADQKLLIGPRVTDGRQDLQPLLDKELTTFLSDQRHATETNQRAITTLLQAMDALSRQQQAMAARELNRTGAGSPDDHARAAETPESPDKPAAP